MLKVQVVEFARAKDMEGTVWYKDKNENSYTRARDGIVHSGPPYDKNSVVLELELEVVESF